MHPTCEIVCTLDRIPARWQWQASTNGKVRTSETFDLFYDCVTDARRCGFEPHFDGKPIVCGASKPLPASV
jgi:hypothetical protein